MLPAKIVTYEEWLTVRRALLSKEKELTRRRDELARERQALPWVRVAKSYRFQGPEGELGLLDLFGGRGQLAVYHFMFGPGWSEGCPVCSLCADHLNASAKHLTARDVTLALVSRAPYTDIAPFKERMGWQLPWVSSFGCDFNYDFHVSFPKEDVAKGNTYYNYDNNGFPSEEAGGMSIFVKDEEDNVFHTYSTYSRGGEPTMGIYNVLDLVPKGRDERELPWPTAWVRHRDRYDMK